MSTSNESLLRAIETAASSRADGNEETVYQHLIDCVLVVAQDDRAATNTKRADASTAPLLRLQNSAGEAAVLAFTGVDTLNLWRKGCPFVELPARLFFQNLIPLKVDLVVLNMGGPIDAIVPRVVFGLLGQGIVPLGKASEVVTLQPGSTVFYRQASGPIASALIQPLRLALRSMKCVIDAYLVEQRMEPNGPGSIVLAVGFDPSISPAERKSLMDQLGAIPNQLLSEGESLVIKEVTSSFRNQIQGKIEPLFP